MPKIAVIIPSYNKAEYVAECIQSVQQQTFSDFECIIVDDGSTDNSREVVSKLIEDDSRFKILCNTNHGLSYSRNYGIQHAAAELILPLDADDYIEMTYLERAVKAFEESPDITLYYGRWQFIGFNAEEMNQRIGGLHYTTYRELLKGNSIHCCCAYRKADAVKAGLYDEKMQGYEDWEFLIRLLYKDKKVIYDPRVSLYYRQLQHNMSEDCHRKYVEKTYYIQAKNSKIFREVLNEEDGVFFKIVIPNYNNEKYVEQCLQSIKRQTFTDYKVIFIDDQSTDSSFSIAKKFEDDDPEHFVCLKASQKSYQGICRNIGMECPLKSKYTWFIDSDDYIKSPDALMSFYAIVKAYPQAQMVTFDYEEDREGTISYKKAASIYPAVKAGIFCLMGTMAPWARVYKTDAIADLRYTNVIYEDLVFLLKFLDRKPSILECHQAFYRYRINQNGDSQKVLHRSQDMMSRMPQLFAELKSMAQNFQTPELKTCVQRYLAVKDRS